MTEIEIPPASFFEKFKSTNGAFSTPEAIALYNIVLTSPEGTYLELGSHKGKSSIVIASSMKKGSDLHLVEPEFSNQEWRIEVSDRVGRLLPESGFGMFPDYSLNVIPRYDELSFCFVDSGVHDDMVMDEVKMLEDRMIENGIIAFHDYGNQFTAVARAYDYLVATGKYEPIPINWKLIFDYVRSNNLEEGNVSWHEKGSEEFPKFVGAVRRK